MAISALRLQGLCYKFKHSECLLAALCKRSLRTAAAVQNASQTQPRSSSQSEQYIPITRRSIVRHLIQAKEVLNEDEQSKFDRFADALDSAVVRRHEFALQELKNLFEPINPDKDTARGRMLNRHDRLDSEFWLLKTLSGIMERANFAELDRDIIEKALNEHSSSHGVRVVTKPGSYDTLRVWVLGKELKPAKYSPPVRLERLLRRKDTGGPQPAYQRLVIAVREKKDDKLMIKAFKDIPISALDQILPRRKLKMSTADKVLFSSFMTLSLSGIAMKYIAFLAQVHSQWSLVFSAVFALTAMRTYVVFKNRQIDYLSGVNEQVYYHNIANNRGLLGLLVDRSADEMFKEALLAYTFLLTSRQPNVFDKRSCDQTVDELGNITTAELEAFVEGWVYRRSGAKIRFNAGPALGFLGELGLVEKKGDSDQLSVLPLDVAIRNMPLTGRSLVPKADDESDIVEGFDRDVFDKWIEDSAEKRPSFIKNPLAMFQRKE